MRLTINYPLSVTAISYNLFCPETSSCKSCRTCNRVIFPFKLTVLKLLKVWHQVKLLSVSTYQVSLTTWEAIVALQFPFCHSTHHLLCWQCPLKHTIINQKWHTVINTTMSSKTSTSDLACQLVLMKGVARENIYPCSVNCTQKKKKFCTFCIFWQISQNTSPTNSSSQPQIQSWKKKSYKW